MKQYFIEGTNKRYSIRKDGEVISHYFYSSKGKYYQEKKLAKFTNNKSNKTVVVNLMFGKYSDGHRMKTIYVNTLMIKYFKIKMPDKYHRYIIAYKDGNNYNHSLSNMYYKILTEGHEKYEPEIYYDTKTNEIIAKKCSHCGNVKDIDEFHLQPNHNTYRNNCEVCRCKKRYNKIKNDPVLHARVKKQSAESAKRHRAYHKVWLKTNSLKLTDSYISHQILKTRINETSPEIIETARNILKIKRELKSNNVKIR